MLGKAFGKYAFLIFMVLETWGDVIFDSLQRVTSQMVNFLPMLLGAVVLFIIGWIVAIALGKVVEQVVRALRVDQLLSRLEVEKAMERAGWRLNAGAFVGGLVKWFLIVVFLLAAANALGLNDVSAFLRDVLNYLPQVIVAVLILIIAALVADTVERIVRGSVQAAGHRGSLAGVTVRWAIWIFAVFAVLIQLGIARELVLAFVQSLVYGVALAFALAFGIGGKDAAAQFIEKIKGEIHR